VPPEANFFDAAHAIGALRRRFQRPTIERRAAVKYPARKPPSPTSASDHRRLDFARIGE
jgi:hypothetical protein